jgi:hypothetical protein
MEEQSEGPLSAESAVPAVYRLSAQNRASAAAFGLACAAACAWSVHLALTGSRPVVHWLLAVACFAIGVIPAIGTQRTRLVVEPERLRFAHSLRPQQVVERAEVDGYRALGGLAPRFEFVLRSGKVVVLPVLFPIEAPLAGFLRTLKQLPDEGGAKT